MTDAPKPSQTADDTPIVLPDTAPAPMSACPFSVGMERHLAPVGNDDEIVDKLTSDYVFGPDGLGLGKTPWSTLISFLARTGIQEQTGSNPNETDIESCVKGWGQGPYSSRVFSAETGIDPDRLEGLIAHLEAIAREKGVDKNLITASVFGAFVETQDPRPYSTITGMREAKSLRDRLGSRFRGHIQWQGFIHLCGQLDSNGTKHVTPELLRLFFAGEAPFFATVIEHRSNLANGQATPGSMSPLYEGAPAHIDRTATDKAYLKRKSGLMIILQITGYMLRRNKAAAGPF